jgi:glycosidase
MLVDSTSCQLPASSRQHCGNVESQDWQLGAGNWELKETMTLLEISSWPWLERLSRRDGRLVTLGDVPAADWDALARDGHAFLFLMGVWRRSPVGREIALTHSGLISEYSRVLPGWTPADVVGSPYCVQAYEPDERMGGWSGLDAARGELQQRGIKLVLDLVPNHTAFDHAWIHSHPERYVTGTDADYQAAPGEFRKVHTRRGTMNVACGRDPYFAPWTDVAQLNYSNPDTRAAMRGALRTIAEHCDGVRCDMAMLLLNDVFERTWGRLLRDRWARPAEEFWPATIGGCPGLTFLAEVYWDLEETMVDQGFDFVYDKRLLDCLQAPAAARCLADLLAGPSTSGHKLARFLENHDEPRSAETLSSRLTAAASLMSTLPGLRFFFDGQFEGRRIKTPVQLGRWQEEEADRTVRALYDRVLRFGREELLTRGEWQLVAASPAGDDSFDGLVAYRWRLGDALAVVVVNPGAQPAQAQLAIAGDLPEGSAFDFVDHLTDARYRRSRADLDQAGLYVRLDSGQAHLFTVEKIC